MGNQDKNILPDIRQTYVLNASCFRVWDAISTSSGLAAWFMPNDFQPIIGQDFQLNAGPYGMSECKVVEVTPPVRVEFDWGDDWTVAFELTDRGSKTEFTLIHSGWEAGLETEFGESHPVVRERMAQGWVGLAQALTKYVEA